VILQRYKERSIQRYAEDEELVQGKFDTAQHKEIDENKLLQGKFESVPTGEQEAIQREEKPNNIGLPDRLKAGIENLSGYSMDDVRVHYNSPNPAQLQALAYTQRTDIYMASGQEKHLAHEAWHVVQQKQGRVQPTMQLQGVNINDNKGLEKEADDMGACVLEQNTEQMYLQRDVKMLEQPQIHQNGLVVDSKLRVMNRSGGRIKSIQRLADRHALTMPQYAARIGWTVLGWGRLIGHANFDLQPVNATAAGHAEDHLIEQANAQIAAVPGAYIELEIWISSSPCSTVFGTRGGVAAGCLEELHQFSITSGMIVRVHAQKPYQPRGMGAGMKQNSVNAANAANVFGVPHDFDARTGVAATLPAYVAPVGAGFAGLGTVAQLFEDKNEQLIRHTEKEKRTEGKVIITYE
jgi:hypothetical protein